MSIEIKDSVWSCRSTNYEISINSHERVGQRFVVPFPDWAVRVIGIVMLCAIFMVSFSTAHMVIGKK